MEVREVEYLPAPVLWSVTSDLVMVPRACRSTTELHNKVERMGSAYFGVCSYRRRLVTGQHVAADCSAL